MIFLFNFIISYIKMSNNKKKYWNIFVIFVVVVGQIIF